MKLFASSEEMQIHEITFCASKLIRGILNFPIIVLTFVLIQLAEVPFRIRSQVIEVIIM